MGYEERQRHAAAVRRQLKFDRDEQYAKLAGKDWVELAEERRARRLKKHSNYPAHAYGSMKKRTGMGMFTHREFEEMGDWRDGGLALGMIAWLFAASFLTAASGLTGFWAIVVWVALVGPAVALLNYVSRKGPHA